MIRDLLREQPGPDDVADVCIVGAGAAGICLAVDLASRGRKVLLLEGGGREIEEAAQEPYRSEVVGLRHNGIHTGRFRAHGGTTRKWGGQILELDAIDFAQRPWVAGSGWPIPKSELTRHYARAMQLEGVSGAIQQDAEVWRELKLTQPQFEGMEPYFSRWCPDPDFTRVHAKALEGPEIAVWLHANAVEMLLEGERVAAIRCRTQAGGETVFRSREYVFCLGAIESARFFLQPREGGLPWNESGLVGKHYQDHIDANIAEVKPRDWGTFSAMFDNVFLHGYKYHPKVRLRPEVEEREAVLNCAATMAFASDAEETAGALKATAKHLLRGRMGEVSGGDLARMVRHAPLLVRQTLRYGLAHRAYNPRGARVQLRVHCEQEPLSASSVTLAEERDSLGMLRTRLDWRISELEMRSMRTLAGYAVRALAGVAEVTPSAELMSGGMTFASRCDDSNHHMGGMRMHASPREGVVDTDLRLHGTSNCFVCSGAVFPTSGFSNPTHTVLALAMRLAEKLGT